MVATVVVVEIMVVDPWGDVPLTDITREDTAGEENALGSKGTVTEVVEVVMAAAQAQAGPQDNGVVVVSEETDMLADGERPTGGEASDEEVLRGAEIETREVTPDGLVLRASELLRLPQPECESVALLFVRAVGNVASRSRQRQRVGVPDSDDSKRHRDRATPVVSSRSGSANPHGQFRWPSTGGTLDDSWFSKATKSSRP